MKHLLIIVLLAGLCACTKKSFSPEILDEETFESIYIALLDSAQLVQGTAADSVVHPVAQRILERHGATLAQLRATVAHYNDDTEMWKEFFQRLTQRMEERRTQKSEE